MKLNSFKIGSIAFLIVLLLMPFGHALMVLNERLLVDYKLLGAFMIGVIGFYCLIEGVKRNSKATTATILGLLAGVLIWTGWVEFSFVWIAEKLGVPGLEENGEVVTKSEYLVMMSSAGLLLTFLGFFLYTKTKCTFFSWFQKIFKIKRHLKKSDSGSRPLALITFVETIMLLWTFYIVLLLVYDNDIAGDRHPATYIVAFGSLLWSGILSVKLIKISKLDYAIRYAIPTVIIFWNFIEIAGRWNFFHEIWVHPLEHWIENLLILLFLVAFIVYYFYESKETEKNKVIRKSNPVSHLNPAMTTSKSKKLQNMDI